MSDGVVRVAPDSTGKFIDTEEIVVGANTVERQRIQLAGALAAAIASVLNAAPAGTEYALVTRNIPSGTQTVQGYQPVATVQSAITTVSNQAPIAAASLNVCTLSLRTFTGTAPSITFKLQASEDGGTTWFDIQGVNNANGAVSVLWTQASALAVGVGGLSIDYTIGGYTHVRVAVTAISGATATAAFSVSLQSMPYEATPAVILNGSDGTLAQLVNVTAKGAQGTRGLATQDLKDAGRSRVAIVFQAVAPATADTLLTLVKTTAGVAAAGATSIGATAGKTLRITSMTFSLKSGAAAAAFATLTLRQNPTGATLIGSASELRVDLGNTAATIGAADKIFIEFPDGLEFSGAQTLGISLAAQATTNVISISLNGFEY